MYARRYCCCTRGIYKLFHGGVLASRDNAWTQRVRDKEVIRWWCKRIKTGCGASRSKREDEEWLRKMLCWARPIFLGTSRGKPPPHGLRVATAQQASDESHGLHLQQQHCSMLLLLAAAAINQQPPCVRNIINGKCVLTHTPPHHTHHRPPRLCLRPCNSPAHLLPAAPGGHSRLGSPSARATGHRREEQTRSFELFKNRKKQNKIWQKARTRWNYRSTRRPEKNWTIWCKYVKKSQLEGCRRNMKRSSAKNNSRSDVRLSDLRRRARPRIILSVPDSGCKYSLVLRSTTTWYQRIYIHICRMHLMVRIICIMAFIYRISGRIRGTNQSVHTYVRINQSSQSRYHHAMRTRQTRTPTWYL